jgi:putative Mn2+ efflux pump MntP
MFIFFTLLIIAVGLSMDTFSLSLGYGMFNISKNNILKISICVGLFHFLMPIVGSFLGELILSLLPINEKTIIGLIFLTISVDIIISLFKKEDLKPLKCNIEILIFSFTVSIDSFSTGIGLDVFNVPSYISSFIFMLVSFIFTYMGLILGKKLHNIIGHKAEITGIIILLFLSIHYLFN